jgi:hypothetical protein
MIDQGNVKVLSGAVCTLDRVTVTGNVIVEPRNGLVAKTVTADGSIQADGHTRVTVTASSRVTDDIQINQGGGARVTGT